MEYLGHTILTTQWGEVKSYTLNHDIFVPMTCTCGRHRLPGKRNFQPIKGIYKEARFVINKLTHDGRYLPVSFSCHQKEYSLLCSVCGKWVELGQVYADMLGEPFKAYVCFDCLAYGKLAAPDLPYLYRAH